MEARISDVNTGDYSKLSSTSSQQIMELLAKLKVSIENDPALKQPDKEQALEQVNVLAEAAKTPDNSSSVNLAQRALRMLKGIVSELPASVSFAANCSQILPLVGKMFGL